MVIFYWKGCGMPGVVLRDSLGLGVLRDEDLVRAAVECADADGWFNSEVVAGKLGCERRCVGSRFGWLVRFGVLEKSDPVVGEPKNSYCLTSEGEAIFKSSLSAAMERALSSMRNGKGFQALSFLMARDVAPVDARVQRREFRHWDEKRPR
jgi:hypothetical protein